MLREFLLLVCYCFLFLSNGHTQMDSILSRINPEMDFRFRAEQDWNSRKSDGTLRENRTRLRYRFRTGMTYNKDWFSMGFRIRTGNQRKQQDPQLTLGTGFEEFGTLPLGFEKIFFQGKYRKLTFWLGKNTFPFEKNNELFWSDNVFPEGVFIGRQFDFDSEFLNRIQVKGGHFILSANGSSFINDASFQGLQTVFSFKNNRFLLFPSLYLYRNIPNIPDGGGTYTIDYPIFHLGSSLRLLQNKNLRFDIDLYRNLQDYGVQSTIKNLLKNEKNGFTLGIKYGHVKQAKSWLFKLTYAYIEKYAVVDFMAQNDWARWDYSSNNSPDGRLSNFNGIELVSGYAITKKINIIVKYYTVKQLVSLSETLENGQRIRFDINVKI